MKKEASSLTPRQLEALLARGITHETAEHFGLSGCGDRTEEWIRIPTVRAGKVQYYKYRTIWGEKKFGMDTGAQVCFWNYDALDPTPDDDPLFIVEGEFDGMIMHQCGYRRVVSVPAGAGSVSFLDKKTLKKLEGTNEIIICGDQDAAGDELIELLGERLTKPRCKRMPLPKDCNDINDVYLKYGENGLIQSFTRSTWLPIGGVYSLSQLPPFQEKEIYEIGIEGLDNHYKIRLGDFCVVTGIPGHGKSSFLNDVCCRMAVAHGFKTAFASFEQDPHTDHYKNLTSWFHSKAFELVSPEDLKASDAWIEANFVFINPSLDDEVRLDWVLERAAACAVRHNCKIIVIDPWNEMDHCRPRDMTITEYTGAAIKEFKRFARKYDVHLIIAAHPTKLLTGKDGKVPMPTMHSISDSAHWYNKADIGIIVHRAEEGDIIKIAKSRYHDQIGRPGTLEVEYSLNNKRYTARCKTSQPES